LDDIGDELEAISERIKLFRKKLSDTTQRKRWHLLELKKLSDLEDQLKIKLDEELSSEKVLSGSLTEKLRDGCNWRFEFNTVEHLEKEINGIPLDTVEESYPIVISYAQDADPNDMQVKLEEVHSSVEEDMAEHVASQDVLNESTALEEYPDSYNAASDSWHADQSMDSMNNTEVDETFAAITSVMVSSTWQNRGSCSNTAKDITPVLRNATKYSSGKFLRACTVL